ncbi:MAG: tetratricopeptide repeat protein [Desulfobacterales bacterium]|nr:tetratricopeptide repeat protein [Desulfobacterales bacterium]
MTNPTENQDIRDQFLLAKSGSEPAPDGVSSENFSIDTIHSEFPEILENADFFQKGMAHVAEADRFGALVFQVDAPGDLLDPNKTLVALMRHVDGLCQKKNGLWGIMDNFRVGVLLPETDKTACMEAVDRLKDSFSRETGRTVTAGVAVYPTITYDKSRILENAEKAVRHAEFFGPDSRAAFDAVSLNISGDRYYQNGDIDSAIREFKLALMLDPKNVNVHNSLGVCYGVKENFDEALTSFNTAMRLEPDEVMPIYNTGFIYTLKKKYSSALEYFHKAARIDPEVYELAFQTGRVYLETDDPRSAVKYLETATRLNPKSGPAFRLLGDCYHLLDRLTDAVNAYKNVLKINSEDAEVLSALGFIYEIQEQNADIALMFCQRASQIDPDNGLFRHRLARIYYNRRHLPEALDEFQKAHDLGYDSSHYIQQTTKYLQDDQ